MARTAVRPSLNEPLDMSVIENNIGQVLRVGLLSFFRSMNNAMAEFGMRPSLGATLLVIEANPDRKQQEIGEAVGIKRPNFVVVIDELEQMGLVRRHRAVGDARSYALRLTAKGVTTMKRIRAKHDAHEKAALESMGEDREAFFRAMAKLRAFSDGNA